MSEFKYACPVCGQHIKCDSSQAGTVMDCPTCFQKITVPQAPADGDQKFILTGTKAEPKTSRTAIGANLAVPQAQSKKSPVAAIVVIVLLLVAVAGAGAFLFRDKLFAGASDKPGGHGGNPGPGGSPAASPTNPATPAPKPPPPKPVAPPANDTNWMLELADTEIPHAPVAGRIHGQDFIIERAGFSGGTLTLRQGNRGAIDFGATINFEGAQAESLSGKTINISTNADKAARVTLRWKVNDQTFKDSYDNGYAMRLEFGELAKNRLPGKIYLCIPDTEKSYLEGTFTANIPQPKPPKK